LTAYTNCVHIRIQICIQTVHTYLFTYVNFLRNCLLTFGLYRFDCKAVIADTLSYESICRTVDNAGSAVFLDGFGGTGKTFMINLILARVQSERKIALAVASSGIAATLLDTRATAHSQFKIPVAYIYEASTCNILTQSMLTDLIQETE
jgi:PIF1-like helicase